MMDVMRELQKIGVLYTKGDFDTGLNQLRQLWESIPNPKTDTLNAYLVLEYGVGFALKKRDLDEAQEWASLAPGFERVRQDMGEVEFLVGKVAFERREFDRAKQSFLIANAKSEGRAFEGEDPKYRN
jgi:hypothetical protein